MQLTDFYLMVHGDYDEVKGRLMTDERILKYLRKFPCMDDYENLEKALEAGQWQDAFRFSHNLKGMCMNLGLQSLYEPSCELCENLRGGSPAQPCGPLMEAVAAGFSQTTSLIAML